jgi:hypothetical protein
VNSNRGFRRGRSKIRHSRLHQNNPILSLQDFQNLITIVWIAELPLPRRTIGLCENTFVALKLPHG